MPQWNKVELRKITQYREGKVYKTQHIRYEWFEFGKQPELYVKNDQEEIWCCLSDEPVISPTKPEV